MRSTTCRLQVGFYLLFVVVLCGLSTISYAESSSPPADAVLHPPAEMGAASLQVPPGMHLKIRFLSPLNTGTSKVGDVFLARSVEDLWANEHLVLPKGTLIRGRVSAVERAGFFSRGGLLRLDFDHVTMPSGELVALSLQMDAASPKMNREKNGFYTDPGIGSKLNTSLDKGISQFKEFHDKGIKAGEERGGGVNMLLTVPTNTVAGVATGTAVTTLNAAKAVFGKGENVTITPDDELIIDFSKAATVRSQ